MKLWHKFFLCMLFLSVSVLCLYGGTLIGKNHRDNLAREQEHSINEMDLIRSAIENVAQVLGDELQSVSWYGAYYEKKKIYFSLFQNGEQVYTSLDTIPVEDYRRLLQVQERTKRLQILDAQGKRYMAVSHFLGEDGSMILVYLRDIDVVYQIREENLRQFGLWILGVMGALAIVAYLCSRWLTRPLERLQKSVEKLDAGDYSVAFPQGSDEIGSLGKAFGKMSQAVEEREEHLRREMERRQQFIEAMTHEMNTPLTSIQGYAQFLLQANCTREQQQVALANVEAEARRMRDMYQKLKELHLMQADGVKTELVRIAEVMVEIREELGYLLEEKKMELKEYYPVQELYTDRMLLYILLSNLIRNSINYSGEEGRVFVTLQQASGQRLLLEVQDWGCGIPRESIERLTEPFYRVDKSRSRKTGGSGIGLYLCSQIVEKLKGTMEIESEEKKGTRVRVYLAGGPESGTAGKQNRGFTDWIQDGDIQGTVRGQNTGYRRGG